MGKNKRNLRKRRYDESMVEKEKRLALLRAADPVELEREDTEYAALKNSIKEGAERQAVGDLAVGFVTNIPYNASDRELEFACESAAMAVGCRPGAVVGCRIKLGNKTRGGRRPPLGFVTFRTTVELEAVIDRQAGLLKMNGRQLRMEKDKQQKRNVEGGKTTTTQSLALCTWAGQDRLTEVWRASRPPELLLDYAGRRLQLTFDLRSPGPDDSRPNAHPDFIGALGIGSLNDLLRALAPRREVKVVMRLKELRQARHYPGDPELLYLVLRRPPCIWWVGEGGALSLISEEKRTTDILSPRDAVGQCLVYRIELPRGDTTNDILQRLNWFGLSHSDRPLTSVRQPLCDVNNIWSDTEVTCRFGEEAKLDFAARYLVHCLVSAGIVPACALTLQFQAELSVLQRHNAAVPVLQRMLRQRGIMIYNPDEWVATRREAYITGVAVLTPTIPPSGCALVRHAMVTPLRIIFTPPEVESSNRGTPYAIIIVKLTEGLDAYQRLIIIVRNMDCYVLNTGKKANVHGHNTRGTSSRTWPQ